VRLAAPWTPTPRAQWAGGALTSTFRPLTAHVALRAPPLTSPNGGQLGIHPSFRRDDADSPARPGPLLRSPVKEIRTFGPSCLLSYQDTPQIPMGKITKEIRGSILAPCSRHLFARSSAPEPCVNRPEFGLRLGRTPSTCLSTARGLLPRCI